MTTLPAQTSVSLLARAMRFFASIAASVGRRPTAPETAVTTHSALFQVAASMSPASPLWPTATPVPWSAARRRSFAPASKAQTYSGRRALVCSRSRSIFLFVVSAAAFMPKRLQTSTLWRPMLPVEPRMTVLFII